MSPTNENKIDKMRSLSVAIVHDWLTVYGGAERVLEEIIKIFPQADLYTIVDFIPKKARQFLGGRRTRTSFIQSLPFAEKYYRSYMPMMPLAIEQFDLSRYNLIISSSYAVAKGVVTGPDQLHLSYVHSPVRYAWDLQHQYLRQAQLTTGMRGLAVRYFLHRLRIWDVRTANGVDAFAANSAFIARRIWKAYRREASVIHPPVDVSRFSPGAAKSEFYLTASRLVPYKRVDLIVDAFRQLPNQRLVVIGEGPESGRIRSLAGPNVEMMGYQPPEVLIEKMQRAKAFIFAAEEDFGIVPVEAQACGTPVIAFAKGGVLETVLDKGEHPTGMFFYEQAPESIRRAVIQFETGGVSFSAAACRQQALLFAPEVFQARFLKFVNDEMNAWNARTGANLFLGPVNSK